MRRDYFTCVFLGLIAGALMFVCFEPLYFQYGAAPVARDFTLFERMMSLLYAVFFIIFLPFFSAFRSKVWVNWGLAAYGVLIYLPAYLYPAEEAISGSDPSMLQLLRAACLRGIYAMMQAPFAALSPLIGDKAAASLVYWILPTALIWPFVLKVFRFYRRAYLSEQLNPMPKVKPTVTSAHSGPAVKPEVLGTVISAPEVAASPDEVKGKAALAKKSSARKKAEPEPSEKKEEPPIQLGAPAAKEEEPIQLDAPAEKKEEAPVIQLGAPAQKEEEAPAIQLGAPSSYSSDADDSESSGEVRKSGRSDKVRPATPDVIQLGAPLESSADGHSDDNVENDNDTL